MKLADMHLHLLYGVDDGAKTKEEMFRMADAAYRDGIRTMCVTPHFHKGFFKDNVKSTDIAFEELSAYFSQKYPDMELYRGNELRYSPEFARWIDDGECHTINNGRYLLVDFLYDESEASITKALHSILNSGYVPILAHVERYLKLRGKLKVLEQLKASGVLIQLDADSLTGANGIMEKRAAVKLIHHKLADIVASDAHDTQKRPNLLKSAYQLVLKSFGTETADKLFWDNPISVIRDKNIQRSNEEGI